MNSPITRRATFVSIASSSGSSNRALAVGRGEDARSPAAPPAAEPDRLAGGIARRDVEPGLGQVVGGRVGCQPGALGHDPGQLADLELGPLVAQERQGEPLARGLRQRARRR